MEYKSREDGTLSLYRPLSLCSFALYHFPASVKIQAYIYRHNHSRNHKDNNQFVGLICLRKSTVQKQIYRCS